MMINDFFDCTNVRSLTEHVKKRNHFIKPYNSQDENYSDNARGKMFLSSQAYEGFKITIYSHVEAIQFLLGEGFQYVLSARFMQDVLEDYFGHQRAKGGRSDNPTAQQFGYSDLTIAAQRDIAPVTRKSWRSI